MSTLPPFTQSWADAFRRAVNADVTYREAGHAWNWPLAFILDDGAPVGLIGPVALELVMERGACRSARIISPDACTSPFVFRAPYEAWKLAMSGDEDVVMLVLRGTISFSGSLGTLATHARAMTALLRCAQELPTDFHQVA